MSDEVLPPPSPAQPDSATETASAKPKWSKGKLAGVIGGGCCGLILLALIGIVILGMIIGPTEEPDPATAPTTAAETTAEAPAEEPTTEAEPTEEATTEEAPVEEATTEAEPTEEATTEPTAETSAAEDPQAWADAVEQTALMGSADWQELCGGDYSLGACWISDVSSTKLGTLDVTLQLAGSDAEAKGLAEGAANIIFSTAGFDHEDLDWVVVYDAEGVVIDQKKRSDYPLLAS